MNSHTETEAKTKWCPAVRSPLLMMGGIKEHLPSVNRNDRGEAMGACIGSLCMWWRWDPNSGPSTVGMTQAEKIAAHKEGPQPPTRGYCGAAAR